GLCIHRLSLRDKCLNICPRSSISFTCLAHNIIAIRNMRRLNGRNRLSRKRRASYPINHQGKTNLPDTKPNQIFWHKNRLEVRPHYLGIKRPNTEGDKRTNVAKNRRTHALIHLLDILISERKRELVFATFRKDICE